MQSAKETTNILATASQRRSMLRRDEPRVDQSPTRLSPVRLNLRKVFSGDLTPLRQTKSNRSIESDVSQPSVASANSKTSKSSKTSRRNSNQSQSSSKRRGSLTLMPQKQQNNESSFSQLPSLALYQELPSICGFDDDEPGALPNPQEYLERLLDQRGFSTKKFSALQTAYRCDPTPLQRASFHTYFFSLVLQQEPNGGSNLETIRKIFSTGVSPNACNTRSETLVHSLARLGKEEHLPVLKILVEEFGASVQVCDDNGRTPLHEACFRRRLSQHQRRRSSRGSAGPSPNGQQPLPPCFDIVDLIAKKDVGLFFLKDSKGNTPLMYVEKEHWLLWLEYLDAQKDEFWPKQKSNSLLHNTISRLSPLKKQIPSLAALPPNAKPLRHSVQANSSLLNPQIASRVVSGRTQPEEVEELKKRKNYKMDYYSASRSAAASDASTGGSGAASVSEYSGVCSSDDSYIGTWLKPNSSSTDEDDYYADNIMLGGLQIPTLRYALVTKDYSYNHTADNSSACPSSSDSSLSFRQTEGEETSEHRRRNQRILLEQNSSFSAHAISESSISSGEATSEASKNVGVKPKYYNKRRRKLLPKPATSAQLSPRAPKSLSQIVSRRTNDWGNNSHSSRNSEADTIESQLGRDSERLALGSCASDGLLDEDETIKDLYHDSSSHESVRVQMLPGTSYHSLGSKNSSIWSISSRSFGVATKMYQDSSAHTRASKVSLDSTLHIQANQPCANTSIHSRTSIISLERTKFHDPSSTSSTHSRGSTKSVTLKNPQKLKQTPTGHVKHQSLSALDMPGLRMNDDEDVEDLDLSSLVSSTHKSQTTTTLPPKDKAQAPTEKRDRRENKTSIIRKVPDGPAPSFMMFL